MSLNWLLKSFEDEDTKPKKFDQGTISLTGILQRKRLKLSRAKGPRKASLYFNPSSIAYGFCMREKVAQLAGYHEIWIKPPTPKEQLVFDTGHKYHDLFHEYFTEVGMLEGFYKCLGCKETWWARSPEKCPNCEMRMLKYEEVPLMDKEYQIRGRADGILWVEVDKNVEVKHLFDLKTISNKGVADTGSYQVASRHFEDLDTEGPLQYQIIQLQLYMRMTGIHDAHLLYVGKNSRGLKSFHITYNAALLRPYLDTIQEALEWAKDLKEGTRRDLPAPCDSKKCACEEIVRPSGKVVVCRNNGISV